MKREDVDDFLDGDLADDNSADGDLAAAEEPAELDERDRRILAFEKQWWRRAGAKEQAIRDTFGLSATRYYQLLNTLLDSPLALAHDPVVVQRLRRLRASRSRRR
ncbi:hypothetical protein GCM10010399_61290 [Dactylosporangium fulvum]|uniref:DUF3263 domain-containing protein n=2 Tax=Dactylosporangium fulvum TaxID=53359 RepID=A0ABY5VZU7_9ACTN|nr:DUF3263 domain-containing protein [Dactylosporangium fulvum]UWP83333.1 DUF3263 domain-containing protein [Dactylosporangium fulvum]